VNTSQVRHESLGRPGRRIPVHHAAGPGRAGRRGGRLRRGRGETSRSASSCWPRRASQDRGGHGPGPVRVDLAPRAATGAVRGGPSGRHPAVAGGASRSARACLAGTRLIARRLDSPRQVGRSCIRPWAAGQPCPVPGRPRRPARRAAGRAEGAAQGPRRRRGTPGAHAGQGIRARPARRGNQGAQSAAISAPVPSGIRPVSYPGRRQQECKLRIQVAVGSPGSCPGHPS
jgi:hypothetical protein